MFKLWATIKKDVLLLTRDKVGLLLMFIMPIVLAVLIAAIQNNTFKLVNDNKISLLIVNNDTSAHSRQFIDIIKQSGAFELKEVSEINSKESIESRMREKDALVAILIPPGFSQSMLHKADYFSHKVFSELGITSNATQDTVIPSPIPLTVFFHPVLQESFRQSVSGSFQSALGLQENKLLIRSLYASIDETKSPKAVEEEILTRQVAINEQLVSRNGVSTIPNATQHNIPAWTIFAMFFIVVSMGSALVKEKVTGSFVRLKTIPASYAVSLISKQWVYLVVTQLQVAAIFAIGIFVFPRVGLPALNLPQDIFALIVVSLVCGWCAVSYAQCVGVFANTQEQANGFGAVTIVIFAAIGGLLVPDFAMPAAMEPLIKISPLHWCLQSYYGLFLEGGNLNDILPNIVSLLAIAVLFQSISVIGLKQKKLI